VKIRPQQQLANSSNSGGVADHRLVIPVTSLLAVVITVALFSVLNGTMRPDHAIYVSATIAFFVTALIGWAFKPLLGE